MRAKRKRTLARSGANTPNQMLVDSGFRKSPGTILDKAQGLNTFRIAGSVDLRKGLSIRAII
jgi:hypothetical protein